MVKKTVIALAIILVAATACNFWAVNARSVLFHSSYGGLIAAVAAGAAAGIIAGWLKRKKRAAADGASTPRHTIFSFLEHWGTGIGIIILIVSAALLASGSQVGFIFVPEIARSRILALNLHYTSALLTLLFGCFFLADFLTAGRYRALIPGPADIWNGIVKRYLMGKKLPGAGKYLATQKLAFLAFAFFGALVLVTGVIKTAYFIWPGSYPLQAATNIHDVAGELLFILLIIHVLFAVAVPSHWRLLASWFTGKDNK